MNRKSLQFIAGFTLLAFLLWRTDLNEVVRNLRLLPAASLVILIGLQLLNRLLIAFQWKHLASVQERSVTLGQMFHMNLIGTFFEGITPSVKLGGEAVKVWWMRKHLNWQTADSVSLMVMQKGISSAGFFLTLLITLTLAMGHSTFSIKTLLQPGNGSIALNPSQGLPSATLIILYGTLLTVIAATAVSTLGKHPKVLQVMGWFHKTRCRFLTDLAVLFASPGKSLLHLVLSLLIWGNYALQMNIAASAMKVSLHFWVLAAAIYLAYSASMIPLLPGGAGTFEGAMVLVLSGSGIPVHQALALSVLIRIITFWMMFGISALVTGWLWVRDQWKTSRLLMLGS